MKSFTADVTDSFLSSILLLVKKLVEKQRTDTEKTVKTCFKTNDASARY